MLMAEEIQKIHADGWYGVAFPRNDSALVQAGRVNSSDLCKVVKRAVFMRNQGRD